MFKSLKTIDELCEEIYITDFWYDLAHSGRISPEMFLKDEEEINKVKEALKILMAFEDAIEDLVDYS